MKLSLGDLGKILYAMFLFFKVTFHMAASNYYQPFDKCNINCFNIIKHYDACAFLSRMAVSSDF